MQVIARQQNNLALPNDEVLFAVTLDPDAKGTLDDIVIGDQVGGWPEIGSTMLGRDARRQAPWSEEIRVQEHAAGQVRHLQDVR
jgi:hypothetical protein